MPRHLGVKPFASCFLQFRLTCSLFTPGSKVRRDEKWNAKGENEKYKNIKIQKILGILGAASLLQPLVLKEETETVTHHHHYCMAGQTVNKDTFLAVH